MTPSLKIDPILIEIKNLTTGYQNQVVLEKVDLTIHKSDFIGVIGPNGGGKTTLIKAIFGVVEAWSGNLVYHIDRSRIGYLPQQTIFDKAFPISVFDVVLSGLSGKKGLTGRYSSEDKERALQLITQAGMKEFRHKAIGKLSGGQMQRTLLCRALINNPELLILDEPSTYVDSQFEHELFQWLKDLNQNMAILMVSHDIGTISAHIKTIACVNKQLHYHPSNKISNEQLNSYNCPIQIITHGVVPHQVLLKHS